MREVAEFRVSQRFADRLFRPEEGKDLGSVRVIRIAKDDPRYAQIGQLDHELEARYNKPFFFGWHLYHRYSSDELEAAELFHIRITAAFEPTGEECGTIYDESMTCPHCGAGRKQVSGLKLDLRKAPRSKDIAKTIADEWIVSHHLAELMIDAGLTGFELRRVRHKAQYEDDSIDPETVPSGRLLVSKGEESGFDPKSWEFFVWLNRDEQKGLLDQAQQEHVALMNRKVKRRGKPAPIWYELIVNSRRVTTVAPTHFGIDPFDDDPKQEHVCPRGHVSGLNLLSEVSIARNEYDGSDVVCTRNMVGTRRGVLVPSPLLLISPRFSRLLQENKIKGYRADVTYLSVTATVGSTRGCIRSSIASDAWCHMWIDGTNLGRWLERDPLGYVDSMNLYEYVGGTPLTALDPYGLSSCATGDCSGEGGNAPSFCPDTGGSDSGSGGGSTPIGGNVTGGGYHYEYSGGEERRPVPPGTILPPGYYVMNAFRAGVGGPVAPNPNRVGSAEQKWWDWSDFWGETWKGIKENKGEIALTFLPGGIFVKGAAKVGKIARLAREAAKQYPKLAGKIHKHHVIPMYIGGSKKGLVVPLPAPYHQLITNEFRRQWKYGQDKPTPGELLRILEEVYKKYPIP